MYQNSIMLDTMSYRNLFVKLGNTVVIEEIAMVEGNKGLNSGFQMFNSYSFSWSNSLPSSRK